MSARGLDVLLISPPDYRLLNKKSAFGISYGLLQIATVLKNNEINVKVYNADFAKGILPKIKPAGLKTQDFSLYEYNIKSENHPVWVEIRDTIERNHPAILGITINTCQYNVALKIARIAKSIDKEIVVVVGGVHSTIMPNETIREPCFDFVVRGEGEYTMLELVKAIRGEIKISDVKGITYNKNGKVVSTPSRQLIEDINSIPFPDIELLINAKKYPKHVYGNIITVRGCPLRCVFCSNKAFWNGVVRFRTAENVVDEIEMLHKKYGTSQFYFMDPTFNLDLKRVADISNKILERNLDIIWSCNMRADNINEAIIRKIKSSGCYKINLGVESGNKKILELMKKDITLDEVKKSAKIIKKNGIELLAYFILGHPKETKESINDTVNLIKEIHPDLLNILLMTPLPGTEIYDLVIKENRLLTRDWSKYTGYTPIIRTDGLTYNELKKYFTNLVNYAINLNNSTVKRRLYNVRYLRNRFMARIK